VSKDAEHAEKARQSVLNGYRRMTDKEGSVMSYQDYLRLVLDIKRGDCDAYLLRLKAVIAERRSTDAYAEHVVAAADGHKKDQ
jgi:hypothetical protein